MSKDPSEPLRQLSQANGIDCLLLWYLRQQPLPQRIREAARLAQLLLNYGGCVKKPPSDR